MKNVAKIALAVLLGSTVIAPAIADDAHHAQAANKAPQAAAVEMTEGEIKKVNKDTGKLTIRHGELKNLRMSPMTMLFRVKEPAMLERVKPGDKIHFFADNINGQLTVTQLEVQK